MSYKPNTAGDLKTLAINLESLVVDTQDMRKEVESGERTDVTPAQLKKLEDLTFEIGGAMDMATKLVRQMEKK